MSIICLLVLLLQLSAVRGLICQFGSYCTSDSDCVSGNKCNIQSPWYSQCIPDETQYRTVGCISNFDTECTSSSDCCDPGSFCNNNYQFDNETNTKGAVV